ncbi:hypothetical protein AAVH_17463 [Aphelenchoides avenae]|nr:hypothetical protein AAVH_17463 [Aphelenchus avenae]
MEIESAHSCGIDAAVRKACLAYLADNDVVPIDKHNIEKLITILTTKISAQLKESNRLSEQWDNNEDEYDGYEEDFVYDEEEKAYWEEYEDDYGQYENDYEPYEDDYEQYENDYEQYENDYEQYEKDYEQYEDDHEQYETDYEQYEDDYMHWEDDYMQYEEEYCSYEEEYEYPEEEDEQYEGYYQSQDENENCDDYYGHYEDESADYDNDYDNWEEHCEDYEDDNEHNFDYYYEQWCNEDNDDGYSSHEIFDDNDDYFTDVECRAPRTVQKSTTSTQTDTTRTARADAETQTLESSEIGECDKVKVLTINDGDVGYDYGRIFAPCCGDSVHSLVVEDPYAVKEDYQMNNWAVFCWTVGQRCANLKLIDLCSAHWHDGLKDLMFLLKEKHDIKLSFTAFKAKDNHPRLFKFDSGWRVIADVGLDIYSGGFRRYEAGYNNYKDRTCRKTYFTYCPPGIEAPVLPIDEDIGTSQSAGLSNSRPNIAAPYSAANRMVYKQSLA